MGTLSGLGPYLLSLANVSRTHMYDGAPPPPPFHTHTGKKGGGGVRPRVLTIKKRLSLTRPTALAYFFWINIKSNSFPKPSIFVPNGDILIIAGQCFQRKTNDQLVNSANIIQHAKTRRFIRTRRIEHLSLAILRVLNPAFVQGSRSRASAQLSVSWVLAWGKERARLRILT